MLVSDFIDAHDAASLQEEILPLPHLSGGTCLLYLCRQGGKRLLLKKLKPEFAGNPRYLEVFRKEFETGHKLTHPNLVKYDSLQLDAQGIPVIAMDYIEGETLNALLGRDPGYFNKTEHLLKFCKQLLSCLDYLHRHQVLHLDLKPDNLMITQVGNDLKVIDLGFCYSDVFPHLKGMNAGFSAPEQSTGTRPLTARTDLYAAGKILEFVSHNTKSEKYLKKIIRKSTQPDPSARYDSAPEMLSEIERSLPSVQRRLKLAALFCCLLAIAGGIFCLNRPTAPPTVFEDSGCMRFRVLSEDSLTCAVISRGRHVSSRPGNYMVDAVARRKRTHFQVIAIADSAFFHDSDLLTLSVAEGVRSLGVQACMYCANLQNVSLPESLTSIGNDAFSSCPKLREVILPRGIIRLEQGTFVGCSELSRVEFPDSLQSIGGDCFVSTGLRDVVLPAKLRVLERGVFYACRHLQRVTLPASLQRIGDFCFQECDSLTEVINLSPTPQPVTNIFSPSAGKQVKRTLRVPAASISLYQKAPYWQDFDRILPL